jgi:hypothetical protein
MRPEASYYRKRNTCVTLMIEKEDLLDSDRGADGLAVCHGAAGAFLKEGDL